MNPASLLSQSRQSLSEFWAARDARARAMLAAAAAVMALGVIGSLLVDPTLSGRSQLSKNLPVLRQQVAQLQALSKEAAALSEKPARPVTAMTKESIEASLVRKGLRSLSVTLAGNLAKVQLTAVSFADTLDWLGDMQETARIFVDDANMVALDQPGMANVTLTLRQHRNE